MAEQYWGGMAGALLVEDDVQALAGFETHTLFIKDITLSGGAPEPYTSPMDYMHGKEGSVVMVNAQVNPYLPVRPGEVQRLRIINASNARFYRLAIQGHHAGHRPPLGAAAGERRSPSTGQTRRRFRIAWDVIFGVLRFSCLRLGSFLRWRLL